MTPEEIPTYSEREARRRLEAELPSWKFRDGWIQREVPADSWRAALGIARLVAHLAEAARHHPDLVIGRDGLRIRLRHHWAAGVTDADFELARVLEAALPAGAAGRED